MNKLIGLAIISSTLLLNGCGLGTGHLTFEPYVKEIKSQLKIQDEEYRYTWNQAEPSENDAYFIDFYVFSYSIHQSHWFCAKINNEITCKMLWLKHID